MHAEEPRVELFGEPLDDLALAGCVPALEADDRWDLGLLHRILQAAHLGLQVRHGLVIGRLRQTLLHIQCFEHGASWALPLVDLAGIRRLAAGATAALVAGFCRGGAVY